MSTRVQLDRRSFSSLMQPTRCRWAFRFIIVLALSVLAEMASSGAYARDQLAPVTPKEPAFTSEPAKLLPAADVTNLNRIINESRSFGIPFAVRVEGIPTAISAEETQSNADGFYADTPIESVKDADDGLLLLVQIPANNTKGSTAAFAHGKNFFPLGGITKERLDSIVSGVLAPGFAKGTVGPSIYTAVSWIDFDQLFLQSPRLERTHGQMWLARIADFPLVVIMIATGIACGYFAFTIRRQTRAFARPGGLPAITSPFAAGAISRGRVDRAIDTAAVVSLLDTGSLKLQTNRFKRPTMELAGEPNADDPFLNRVWQTLTDIADPRSGLIESGPISRMGDVLQPVRRWQQDELRIVGYLSPRARTQNRALIVACGGAMLIAIYGIAPALISMSRWSIFVAAALILEATLIIWWAARRSVATDAGLRAVDAWKSTRAREIAAGDQQAVKDDHLFRLIADHDGARDGGTYLCEQYGNEVPGLVANIRGYSPA